MRAGSRIGTVGPLLAITGLAITGLAHADPVAGDYAAAMATSRQRIAAKDMPGAVAALTAALAARPDDPTALSELSWASFLAGDFAAAEQAGWRAAGMAQQPVLKAMAFYNKGHAQEAQGKLRSAQDAYTASLALRDNAEVRSRLAGVVAQLMTPRPLIGPFASPQAFCQARGMAADACEVTLDIDHKLDADGQEIAVDVIGNIEHLSRPPFTSVAKIVSDAPEPQMDFPRMNLAFQVGARWFVMPDIGTAASGHGGGYSIGVRMVGPRLVVAWGSSVGRFGHTDEEATIVCGVGASGAPSCAGPIVTEESETEDHCGKSPDCTRRDTLRVQFHCRATLRGDVLEVGRNPKRIENPEQAVLVPPRPDACETLPTAGKHSLAF